MLNGEVNQQRGWEISGTEPTKATIGYLLS